MRDVLSPERELLRQVVHIHLKVQVIGNLSGDLSLSVLSTINQNLKTMNKQVNSLPVPNMIAPN